MSSSQEESSASKSSSSPEGSESKQCETEKAKSSCEAKSSPQSAHKDTNDAGDVEDVKEGMSQLLLAEKKNAEDESELEGEKITSQSSASSVAESARSEVTGEDASSTKLEAKGTANMDTGGVERRSEVEFSQQQKKPSATKFSSDDSQSQDSSSGSTQKVSNRKQPPDKTSQRKNSTSSHASFQQQHQLEQQQPQQQEQHQSIHQPKRLTPEKQKQENIVPVQQKQQKTPQEKRKGRFMIQPHPSNESLPALNEQPSMQQQQQSPAQHEQQPRQSLSPKPTRNLPPQQPQQQTAPTQQYGAPAEGLAPLQPQHQVFVHPDPTSATVAGPSGVVGMVGNTPIMTIPGTNGQVVRKKKGRFKFLQQAPETPPPGVSSGGVAPERPQARLHERSVSMSSSSFVPSTSASGPAALSSNRSLDGTGGGPFIKKKGRFVLTNVTSVPVQTVVTTSQPVVPLEQTMVQAAPMVMAPAGQLFYTTTAPVPEGTSVMATTTAMQHPMVGVQPELAVGPSQTSQRLSPVPAAMNAPVEAGSPCTHQQYQQQGQEQSYLPAVEEAMPRASKPKARAAKTNAVRQNSPGLAGQQGFGKMFYFLDQMRQEVGEADRTIKSLQTDMKCMREKNKELEAKAREMERKWNAERALREVAETRVKALKKKLRALKDDNQELDATREDESVGTQQTGGRHSRANSMDAGIDLSDVAPVASSENVSVANSDSSKNVGEHGPTAPGVTHADKTVSQELPANSSAPSKKGSVIAEPSNRSPLRDTAFRTAPGQQPTTQQKPPAQTAAQAKGPAGAGTVARTNASTTTRTLQRSVSSTGVSNKPNHVRQQPQPPAVNASNVNAHVDLAKNTQGVQTSINPHGVPPRPLGMRTRNESTGSLGSSRPPNTIGFDPLQPAQQQADDNLSLVSEPDSALHMYSSTPVLMMNHSQTMAVPIVGVASHTMDGSDLMSFQTPVVQVTHSQGTSMGMSQNLHEMQQQQPAMGHQQIPSGMFFVPQQVTMQSYHDQPAIATHNTANAQEASQQAPMMTIQQPVLQFQASGSMVPSQQIQWPTPQEQQQQQQQPSAPQDLLSSSSPQDPGDLLSSQPATQQPPSLEKACDPFDALVQKRRPGN